MIAVTGKIVKGRGLASVITLDEIEYLSEATQSQIIPGTANFVSKTPIRLQNDKPSLVYKYQNGREKDFWPASINGKTVYLTRWRNCPLHIFEIFSEEKIVNTHHDLEKEICIFIEERRLKKISFLEKIYWYAVWYGRENWWYRNYYYWRVFRLLFVKNLTGHC